MPTDAFPRLRPPNESREAQITVRMPPEFREKLRAYFQAYTMYRKENDFLLDVLHEGLKSAVEQAKRQGLKVNHR